MGRTRLAQACYVWERLYPSDITLSEEKKGLAFALEFEDKESFFVSIDGREECEPSFFYIGQMEDGA